MTLSFGGGAGVLTIPGLTSDGADGIVVEGAVTAGDASAVGTPTFHALSGSTQLTSSQGNIDDGDNTLDVEQRGNTLAGDCSAAVLGIFRTATLNGHQFTAPAVYVWDQSGSTAPLQGWYGVGFSQVAELGQAGGLGLFGHPAPAAPSTLSQATISAILDANAKTAVQALADCLAAIGVLTIT